MYAQDTPHDCSHAHQIPFKTHHDRENRPRCYIATHPRKLLDSVNMHCNYRKTLLSLPESTLWHHTCTIIIYHHQWVSNQSWGWCPCRHAMGSYETTVTSWNFLPREDYLPASEPLVKADQLVLYFKPKDASMDGFIDGIITITTEDPCWLERIKNVALLVIHTIFRPQHYGGKPETIWPLSLRKLVG